MLRGIVGLAVGAAALSGCAAKEAASTSLPATTSKAAPTTPALPPLGPPDFPVPAAARTKDAAGAEAFLRYYIELMNRQEFIPSGARLREFGPACQECLRIARAFDKTAAAGEHYEGGRVTVNDVPPPRSVDNHIEISFSARAEVEKRVDRTGKVLEEAPFDANVGSAMHLSWADDRKCWIVEALSIG